MPEYIARISYGKDSLKMLDVIHTRGLPLDRITTTDVWATDTISANLPPMEEFKARMDERIWHLYRMDVEHLCAMNADGTKRTYEQMFYHVPVRRSQTVQVERERERRAAPVPGSIYGFPDLWNPWCQSTLKRNSKPQSTGDDYRIPSEHRIQLLSKTQDCANPISKDGHLQQESLGARNSNYEWTHPFPNERPTRRGKRNIVEYIGIAADEPARFGQLNEWKRAPLAEFGIGEGLCGLYCQYGRCLGPSYETSCRDGCWFCHNQGVNSLRNLWRNYPDHWALLLKWDKDSPVTFKADGHTVHDFDKRFRMEEEGWIDMHMPFRWTMLDKPSKFRVNNHFEQTSLFDRR